MVKRIFFIFVGVIFLIGIFPVLLTAQDTKLEPTVGYTLISSRELEYVNARLTEGIERMFPGASRTYLEYSSSQARKYIKKLGIKFVPFVIFDNSITTLRQFPQMLQSRMLTKQRGHFIIPEHYIKMHPALLLDSEKQPQRLDIFVSSLSPASQRVVKRLVTFIRENNLAIQMRLRYLVNIRDAEITSAYGPQGLEEDLRQVIIQKYYPDKFWDYLLLIENKTNQQALKELNIPLEEVKVREKEAEQLLQLDFQATQDLGITRTPTLLWENTYLIPSLSGLKHYPPFNREGMRLAQASITGAIPLEFFHSLACRSCQRIKAYLNDEIKPRYQDKISIHYHNVSDPEELRLKFSMEKKYGILGGSVPQIFLPTRALEGADSIKKNLTAEIDEILKQQDNLLSDKVVAEQDPILERFATFSLAVVTFAGLIDGINPCAFATLIFFVSYLAIHSFRKKQIGLIGSAFIVGVFLTYLGLGLGIFVALQKLQIFTFLNQLIYYAIACLALSLGVYCLWDYIKYKRTGQVKPCSLKFHQRLRQLADSQRGLFLLTFGALINGFLIALLESACTGQVYFPTIAFVLKVPHLRLHALLYLVLYNLAFILPLILIFILAYRGIGSERFTQFTSRHQGAIKLTTAILFFGLALFLFLFI